MQKGKVCLSMLMAAIISIAFLIIPARAEDKAERSRDIHVVWDTSGSMWENNTTRWAEASYALKAFTAMTRAEDSLKIFPMGTEEVLDISGLSVRRRIEKLTEELGQIDVKSYTYYSAVDKAVQAGWKNGAERWLVVVTDGTFTRYSQEQPGGYPKNDAELSKNFQTLLAADPSLNIIYLRIGAGANRSNDGEARLHWLGQRQGEEISDVLLRVNEIIFNRSKITEENLDAESDMLKVDLKIPVKELIVFAQSSKNDLLGSDGNILKESPAAVKTDKLLFAAPQRADKDEWKNITEYRGSLKIGEKYTSFIENSGLINIYTADSDSGILPPGEYIFANNTNYTYRVFYTPAVDIVLEFRKDGQTVDDAALTAGEYDVEIRLKSSLTGEELEDTSGYFQEEDFYVQTEQQGEIKKYQGRSASISLLPGDAVLTACTTLGNYGPVTMTVEEPPQRGWLTAELENGIYFEDMDQEHPAARLILNAERNVQEINPGDVELTVADHMSCQWELQEAESGLEWLLYPAAGQEMDGEIDNGVHQVNVIISVHSSRVFFQEESFTLEIPLEHKPQNLYIYANEGQIVSIFNLCYRNRQSISLEYLCGNDRDTAIVLDKMASIDARVETEKINLPDNIRVKNESIYIPEGEPFSLVIEPGVQWKDWTDEGIEIPVKAEYNCGGTINCTEENMVVVIPVKPLTRDQLFIINLILFICRIVPYIVGLILLAAFVWGIAWLFRVCIFRTAMPIRISLCRDYGTATYECKELNRIGRKLFLRGTCQFDMVSERGQNPIVIEITRDPMNKEKYSIKNYKDFSDSRYRLVKKEDLSIFHVKSRLIGASYHSLELENDILVVTKGKESKALNHTFVLRKPLK